MLAALLLVLIPLVQAQTEAQTQPQTQTGTTDTAMEEALRDYAAVAAGWYVNQRCWFVTGDAREKFNRDLELLNVAMVRDLGRTERLRQIQQSAQIGANRPPYNACGAEAEELVTSTSKHAGLWSDAIREIVAELAAKQAEQDAQTEAVE
jgi:hypothetical protein